MSIDSTVAPQVSPRSRVRARDNLTVGLLVGAVLLLIAPFGFVWATIAWTTGASLLWSSTTWDARDKALGTLVWPGGLIGPALLATSAGEVCTHVTEVGAAAVGKVGEPVCTGFAFSPWVGVPLGVIVIAAPFVVAVFLLNRANSA